MPTRISGTSPLDLAADIVVKPVSSLMISSLLLGFKSSVEGDRGGSEILLADHL